MLRINSRSWTMLTPCCPTWRREIFTTNMDRWVSTWRSSSEKRMWTHILCFPAGGPRWHFLFGVLWTVFCLNSSRGWTLSYLLYRVCSPSAACWRAAISAAVCAAALTAAVGSVSPVPLEKKTPSPTCLLKTWRSRFEPTRRGVSELRGACFPYQKIIWEMLYYSVYLGESAHFRCSDCFHFVDCYCFLYLCVMSGQMVTHL